MVIVLSYKHILVKCSWTHLISIYRSSSRKIKKKYWLLCHCYLQGIKVVFQVGLALLRFCHDELVNILFALFFGCFCFKSYFWRCAEVCNVLPGQIAFRETSTCFQKLPRRGNWSWCIIANCLHIQGDELFFVPNATLCQTFCEFFLCDEFVCACGHAHHFFPSLHIMAKLKVFVFLLACFSLLWYSNLFVVFAWLMI